MLAIKRGMITKIDVEYVKHDDNGYLYCSKSDKSFFLYLTKQQHNMVRNSPIRYTLEMCNEN